MMSPMARRLPSLLPFAWSLPATGVLLLGLALTWHARPLTDDLFIAAHFRDDGFVGAFTTYWTTWGSRWISYAVNGNLPRLLGLRETYGPMLVACWAIWLLALATAGRWLGGLTWPGAVAGAGLVAAVVWSATLANGAAGEFFYWAVGARENLVGVAVPVLGVALLVPGRSAAAAAASTDGFRRWVGVVLLALTPGVHELWGAFAAAWATTGLVATFLSRRAAPPEAAAAAADRTDARVTPWLAASILTIVHLAIVVASPGNAGRAAAVEAAGEAQPIAPLIVSQAIGLARSWWLDPGLILAAFVALTIPAARPAWAARRYVGLQAPLWIAGLSIAGVLAGLVLHAVASGVPMPGRTLGGLHTTLAAGLLLAAFAAGRPDPRLATFASLALSAWLVVGPATEAALRDLKTNAPRWSSALDDHHRRLTAADSDDVVELPPVPPTPAAFWKQEVIDDSEHFRNYHTRIYYRVARVRVVEE